MKILKYVILSTLGFGLSFGIAYFVFFYFGTPNPATIKQKSNNPTPTPTKKSNFTLEEAPSESLVGEIITMDGDIKWQDRLATESATITEPRKLRQGELVETGEKSELSFEFSDYCTASMSSETKVSIIQTLPNNILFSQPTGTTSYQVRGNHNISVRSGYLLAEFDGATFIEVDEEKLTTTITVKEGEVTVAYNDVNYNAHVLTLAESDVYVFNQKTRRGVLR